MTNMKRYNLFILFSTIGRNIVEVFSSVLLYKMGYSLRDIIIFYIILYLTGAVVSIITMYLTKIIKTKYILIFSSIIFSFSFYFMSIMQKTFLNLIIFGIIYGVGSYTYHTLRHYYAIKAISNHEKKEIGTIIIFTNIALIFSGLVASYIQSKLSLIALAITVIIISIFGTFFIFKFNTEKEEKKIKYTYPKRNQFLFFLFEQAKVINLSFQPLYLYLFISGSMKYIGLFNALTGISACLFIYFFVKKIDDKKYFKYLNIIFCLFLLLKMNITSKYLILVIALFEGLGIKMFEVVSTINMYNIEKKANVKGYLIVVEIIFCLTRAGMCLICYFINDLKLILYLSIIPILLVGFINRKDVKF